jgi:hypothetical protein
MTITTGRREVAIHLLLGPPPPPEMEVVKHRESRTRQKRVLRPMAVTTPVRISSPDSSLPPRFAHDSGEDPDNDSVTSGILYSPVTDRHGSHRLRGRSSDPQVSTTMSQMDILGPPTLGAFFLVSRRTVPGLNLGRVEWGSEHQQDHHLVLHQRRPFPQFQSWSPSIALSPLTNTSISHWGYRTL